MQRKKLSPLAYAQQNFRIFEERIHSKVNKEACLFVIHRGDLENIIYYECSNYLKKLPAISEAPYLMLLNL